jgi:NAD(P)-dependent dehydrogenase (short-subunit alcohol dehydrogenase family)
MDETALKSKRAPPIGQRRILVTGASGGLGQAVHARLRWSLRDEVVGTSREQVNFTATPSDAAKWLLAAAGSRKFDGIVHCAGSELIASIGATTDEQYATALETLHGAFSILRAAATGLCANPCSIVLISSLAAHRPARGMAAYAAAKAGIESLAKVAALELAPHGIRVNCIAPGTFIGPMFDRVTKMLPVSIVARMVNHSPLGLGTPQNVADAVEFLLGETSAWVTGTVFHIDGGAIAKP